VLPKACDGVYTHDLTPRGTRPDRVAANRNAALEILSIHERRAALGFPAMSDELEEARATITRLAAENEQLRARLSDTDFAQDLRESLTLAAATGTIGSPVEHVRLLEMVLETAAAVIGARAGSLLLVDRATDELIFEESIGPEGEKIEGSRMPVGKGIAGLVAASGQPMAVSGAEDQRVFKEVGDRIGYHPHSLLCVPLFSGGRLIGVLEMLDKIHAPGFSPEDIRILGMFANEAAMAIELSRTYRQVAPLMSELLASLGNTGAGPRRALSERSEAFANRLEEDVSYQEALDLAKLVQEIAWRGDQERIACLTVLRGFAEYLRSRPEIGER
jgi:GAF domain-containing protein